MDPDQLEDGAAAAPAPAAEAPAPEPSLADKVSEAIGLPGPDAPTDPAPAPAGSAPAKPAATEPSKPVDPNAALYAPLPEHNPRTTQERFQKLIEGHKALDAKVREIEPLAKQASELQAKVQEHEAGWKVFSDMGFNNEAAVTDLQQFASYRNALASGNWQAAGQVIQAQARHLALLSGQKIDVNPLAGYQDLDQRFQGGEIDEATAMELARHRHTQAMQQQYQQRERVQSEQTNQQAQSIHQAARAVDSVVSELMRDADYAKVEPELVKQLQGIKENYPPNMWAREVKRAYDTESRFLRLAAQQTQLQTPTPLRSNGGMGGRPAPTSMSDAVLQSLGLA